jgi:hypothetical protein
MDGAVPDQKRQKETTMKLTIGRRHSIEVASLEEASRVYCDLRDESGEGASTFPNGKVGKYRISYNGKVWLGHGPVDSQLVYDPYAAVTA